MGNPLIWETISIFDQYIKGFHRQPSSAQSFYCLSSKMHGKKPSTVCINIKVIHFQRPIGLKSIDLNICMWTRSKDQLILLASLADECLNCLLPAGYQRFCYICGGPSSYSCCILMSLLQHLHSKLHKGNSPIFSVSPASAEDTMTLDFPAFTFKPFPSRAACHKKSFPSVLAHSQPWVLHVHVGHLHKEVPIEGIHVS